MARSPKGKRSTGTEGVSVAGKAANGAGSVYFDASKGSYRATYIDPATGRRRTVSGRTKGEAESRRAERLAELVTAVPSGRLGPDPTVAALAIWWIDAIAAVSVRPSTLHTYRKQLPASSTVWALCVSPSSTPRPCGRSWPPCAGPGWQRRRVATPGQCCARSPKPPSTSGT